MFFLPEDGRFNEWNLHYFRPLEAHPLLSRLEKKIRKSCVKSFQAWNAKFVRMPRPSKSTAIVLEAKSWPTRTPKNRRRKRLKHHTSWMKPLRIKSGCLVEIMTIYNIILIYIYISSAPRVFSGRKWRATYCTQRFGPVNTLFFFSKTHPFFQSSKLDPQLVGSNIFLFFFYRRNPVHHEKNRLKHMKRSALLGVHDAFQMWGIHRNWARWTSDPTWPLEALKGRFAWRDEEPGTWKIHIYIYIDIYIYIYVYCIHTPLKFKHGSPKNQPLEKEIPFGSHYFQVPC